MKGTLKNNELICIKNGFPKQYPIPPFAAA
jgi:hypothetical protein